MNHHCHADACTVQVPPKLLMCKRHWYMVPKRLRDAVWDHYRPGQEVDKRPTPQYLLAATRAINAVAVREKRLTAEQAELRERHIIETFNLEEEGQPA